MPKIFNYLTFNRKSFMVDIQTLFNISVVYLIICWISDKTWFGFPMWLKICCGVYLVSIMLQTKN